MIATTPCPTCGRPTRTLRRTHHGKVESITLDTSRACYRVIVDPGSGQLVPMNAPDAFVLHECAEGAPTRPATSARGKRTT